VRDPRIVFALLNDNNGYIPTHNLKFSKPLTGDYKTDLWGNRTKRLFNDTVGLKAARNQAPFLLQTYRRDTGEIMNDLSVPVYVFGKHWGAIRIGFRIEQ
jgi:methyl-accepting chemotaxis protein